nr:uncharacterized protein LOC124813134 [Hydra vulgaris]
MNLIWHVAWFFSSKTNPRPNWSGYMMHTTSQSTTTYEKASIKILLIIELNSSDETCIYSTLLFIIDEANKYKIVTVCVTFDQSLWQKALGVIKDQNLNIICRLRGFHTMMSFLGSIGKLMTGSGLEEVLEQVYSEDTVKHILKGKAVARAIRGHMLVQSVLMSHIIDILVDKSKLDISGLECTYKMAMQNVMNKEELIRFGNTDAFKNIECAILTDTKKKSHESRTAKLWILYIYYIGIIKEFLVAERTCNWYLHLQAISKMLNLFAASGNSKYAKSSRLYLKEMQHLSETNPWLHQQFLDGCHALRQSARYCAGLSSDLVIEQTPMLSLKCNGDLTRSRGFDKNVCNLWIMSNCCSACVHEAMYKLSGLGIGVMENNKEWVLKD